MNKYKKLVENVILHTWPQVVPVYISISVAGTSCDVNVAYTSYKHTHIV